MPNIYITNQNSTYDITHLVDTLTLNGEYRSCARTLNFGLLSSPDDAGLPEVDCAVGSAVTVQHEGETIFSGFIQQRTKSISSSTIQITCTDRGLYLNRNRLSGSCTATPEAATADFCREFNIAVGALASTGVTVRRKFFNVSLYEIIATLYTEAAKTTNAAYTIRFEGDKLTVREKGAGVKLVLRAGNNLINATVNESMANIVNRIIVQNQSGATIYDLRDENSIALYGQMQQILKQSSNQDLLGEAKKVLKNSTLQQKITVENLGDTRCITGGAVLLEEPYTNLYGLFYIDADTHTWQNGLYRNTLTLSLKAVMDEKSAGELLGGN